ncbi:zona pellucida-binding protein 2 isoform X4 [Nycticebus coucang]|uniref:zona pellucida-binding protein 2 isoform X4 n=1 Tax=Nycticebus coucang TaxID=9470 RepID=UPI00234C8F89|nr:zona pellucida-binding protein 2 isoform X4 [Nycticebus coucang]
MRAWVLFSAVLWYLAGVGWQRSSLFSKKGYVYGQPGHPVKIYVKLHQNSPVLICMDFKYAKKEIVDPTYIWIGPNEKTLTGNNRINITKIGELLVKDFLEPLSGLYTCTFSYKTVKAETQEEKTIQRRYDFLLFEPSYKCHSVEIPERGLIHELFIAFQVNPFAPGWRSLCNKSDDCEDITNHNVLQARNRIEEFFRSQTYIFYHHVNKTVPAMHFVDHSFQVERLDSCRPGFGKNEGLHSNCATCCVVCSPGTFSPDVDVICQPCISIHIYGAKSCP